MKNIIVGQSGGPTAVINASLYGIINEGMRHPELVNHVYGMVNGIEGFMQDHYLNLSSELTTEQLQLLKTTPAAYLGSCRFKLPADLDDQFYADVFAKLDALNIGWFFYIGGNDSMDTASKLSRYAAQIGSDITFIGIPKTIDNDLVLTDHTPGFASAAKYVATTVREIVLDASVYQQKSVTIVEIMGRHAGWLTAASVLARKHIGDNPLLIYLPETSFNLEHFTEDLHHALATHSNIVVCVSEGIADASGKLICEYSNDAELDNFGHKMLTGCGKFLENYIRQRFGIKVRSVELNVSQRCSGMLASQTDIEEAVMAGAYGVGAALAGETGKMIAFTRITDTAYELKYETVDVNQVCNREKQVPREWINDRGNDLTNGFIQYLMPLIQGEVHHQIKDGLPVYLYRQ